MSQNKQLNKNGFAIIELFVICLIIFTIIGFGIFIIKRSGNNNSVSEAESKPDVYSVHIIAGQSNAVGGGTSERDLQESSVDQKVKFYYQHQSSSDGKIVNLKAQKITSKQTGFGPEIGLARDLYANGYKKILIIKVAYGATDLHNQWKAPNGPLYTKYIRGTVPRALRELKKQGHDYSIDGFYWVQGEADMYWGNGRYYKNDMINFISQVRKDLNKPNLKIIIARTNMPEAKPSERKLVRDAQVKVANTTPNVRWVNTDDLPLSDNLHYSSRGQVILGQRFFEKIKTHMNKHYPQGL